MSDLCKTFVRPEGAFGEEGARLMEAAGRPMARLAVDRLELRAADAVLEIGFGPGLALELISQAVSQGRVAGVDPSSVMHVRAERRNVGAVRDGRMTLHEGVVEQLPFGPSSFDAALAIDNMHFWRDRLTGFREVHRVLRLGGRLVCAFTPPSGGSMSGVTPICEAAGFTRVRVEEHDIGMVLSAVAEN